MPRPIKKKQSQSISIIVPAYNAEKNISACLDALQSQTLKADAVIVVDDGSTDSTAKMISQYYPRIRLISQTNQGPAKARNRGARDAKTDIIVFIDSDCIPEKNWLEEMIKPFADAAVVGVQGAYKTRQTSLVAQFDQMDIEYRYMRMQKSQESRKLDWIATYSAAYRTQVFLAFKGFDETFPKASGEDAELSYRLAEKGNILIFNPRAIVYHTHPATLWNYLRVKFFRAYWRMRMYLKFPGKIIKDSYTPQSLKLGIILGFLSGLFVLSLVYFFIIALLEKSLLFIGIDFLLLISGTMLGLFLGGMFTIFLSPELLHKITQKGIWMKLFAPFIVCLRAIAFGMGMLFGLLDARVRA